MIRALQQAQFVDEDDAEYAGIDIDTFLGAEPELPDFDDIQ